MPSLKKWLKQKFCSHSSRTTTDEPEIKKVKDNLNKWKKYMDEHKYNHSEEQGHRVKSLC